MQTEIKIPKRESKAKQILKSIFKFIRNFFKKDCCKILFLIFSLPFVEGWWGSAFAQQPANPQPDSAKTSQFALRKIPNVQIKDFYGNTINTSSLSNSGKPIILVFWYSVHRFPKRELDALQENYEAWKKETGVKIIVISIDDSRTVSNVLPMVNASRWDFEFYLDINSDFKRAMNVNLVPQTFLINGAGEVVWNAVGFMEGNESVIYDELKKIKK